jgi:5-methylthioribose kinase
MLDTPNPQYRILTASDVPAYLADYPALAAYLGGVPGDWRCRDVADGNLNSVFLVDGPRHGLCVKQALPYVRVAGESWPMDVNRAFFEYQYARRLEPFVGALAPKTHHFDETQFIIVMEKLEPHIILRKAMIAGVHHPRVPVDVADYIAAASFHTSDLGAPFEAKCADQTVFARNTALQRISVDLVFTDPYTIVARNRVIEPLEAWAQALRDDIDLKEAVARARLAYLTKAQSLIHGDLHSGSILVTQAETRIFDGEFAWVGPSGFDIGTFIAHYVMAWYAKPFHAVPPEARSGFRDRVAADIVTFWQRFEAQFLEHWRAYEGETDGYPASHFGDPALSARLAALRRLYVADIFRDAVAFLGCKIIRRVLGFAQIEDFLTIADLGKRAHAQAGALAFARSLLLHPERYRDIVDVVAALPQFESAGLSPTATRHL